MTTISLGHITYGLLFLAVFAVVANRAHVWLEFGAGVRRPIALTLALTAGVLVGGGLCWAVLSALPMECVDFSPEASGRC